jgi:hypothetical protein
MNFHDEGDTTSKIRQAFAINFSNFIYHITSHSQAKRLCVKIRKILNALYFQRNSAHTWLRQRQIRENDC